MLNALLAKQIEAFDISHITPEHLILVRCEINASIKLDLKPFIDRLPKGCLVAVVRPNETIEVLNEELMNRAGWFRKKKGYSGLKKAKTDETSEPLPDQSTNALAQLALAGKLS